MTSSVSGKRATRLRQSPVHVKLWESTRGVRPGRESNPRTGLCRPLPKPLGHPAGTGNRYQRETPEGVIRADDGIRTRDPNLGKVVLYQLSHVRVPQGAFAPRDRAEH